MAKYPNVIPTTQNKGIGSKFESICILKRNKKIFLMSAFFLNFGGLRNARMVDRHFGDMFYLAPKLFLAKTSASVVATLVV